MVRCRKIMCDAIFYNDCKLAHPEQLYRGTQPPKQYCLETLVTAWARYAAVTIGRDIREIVISFQLAQFQRNNAGQEVVKESQRL